MPRRLPVRPAKIIGNLFVLFVLIVMCIIYYSYVGVVWGPKIIGNSILKTNISFIDNYLVMIMLAFFHLLFLMLLWSFF